MKRIYYLVASLDCLDDMSAHIRTLGLGDADFQVMSRDKDSLNRIQIKSASSLHERDVVRWGERGALTVVTLSTCIAVFAGLIGIDGANMTNALLFISISAIVGVVAGVIIGYSKENYLITRFHDEIEQGKHLAMINIPHKYEALIKQSMEQHCKVKAVASADTLIFPFDADHQENI